MNMQERNFSRAEKLDIIHCAEREGVLATLRMYGLPYQIFIRWKRKYQSMPRKTKIKTQEPKE